MLELRLILLLWLACISGVLAEPVAEFFNRQGFSHTNNWAVLVCASRYWFNYRARLIRDRRWHLVLTG